MGRRLLAVLQFVINFINIGDLRMSIKRKGKKSGGFDRLNAHDFRGRKSLMHFGDKIQTKFIIVLCFQLFIFLASVLKSLHTCYFESKHCTLMPYCNPYCFSFFI